MVDESVAGEDARGRVILLMSQALAKVAKLQAAANVPGMEGEAGAELASPALAAEVSRALEFAAGTREAWELDEDVVSRSQAAALINEFVDTLKVLVALCYRLRRAVIIQGAVGNHNSELAQNAVLGVATDSSWFQKAMQGFGCAPGENAASFAGQFIKSVMADSELAEKIAEAAEESGIAEGWLPGVRGPSAPDSRAGGGAGSGRS